MSQCVICVLCSAGTPQSIWGLRGNIRSSGIKIQIQKPWIWQFTNTKGTNIKPWFVPLLVASGNFSPPVKILTRQLQPVVISCSNPAFCAKLPIVHIATQDSLFGQFPGNSVISVRPEMIVGSGWMVEFFLFICEEGEGRNFLEKKSFGWWPPAESVWQRISLIPLLFEGSFSLTRQS